MNLDKMIKPWWPHLGVHYTRHNYVHYTVLWTNADSANPGIFALDASGVWTPIATAAQIHSFLSRKEAERAILRSKMPPGWTENRPLDSVVYKDSELPIWSRYLRVGMSNGWALNVIHWIGDDGRAYYLDPSDNTWTVGGADVLGIYPSLLAAQLAIAKAPAPPGWDVFLETCGAPEDIAEAKGQGDNSAGE